MFSFPPDLTDSQSLSHPDLPFQRKKKNPYNLIWFGEDGKKNAFVLKVGKQNLQVFCVFILSSFSDYVIVFN